MSVMSEDAAQRVESGPVVAGFDGSTSGEDALALALWIARIVGVRAIVAAVHPSPAAISPARVDAEWVADRHRLAEQILDEARQLLGAAGAAADQVEYRILASSSAAHGLHDLALAAKVRATLKSHRETARLDVDVLASDGAITLCGSVPETKHRQETERIARTIPGVQGVKSELIVIEERRAF